MRSDHQPQPTPKRTPRTKGKLTGPKPPLRTRNVWSIRTKLQVEGRIRDLVMFNFAIDSKLRAGDVVGVKVQEVAPYRLALARVTVRQRRPGQPVRFETTDRARQSTDEYIKIIGKQPGDFLFEAGAGEIGAFPLASTRG